MMTKAEKTKQYIIEQTAPLFNTKGVAATAISDIMAVTNLAKGSLYVHFSNKDELAYSVVAYNIQLFIDRSGEEVAHFVSAHDKFFAVLDLLSDPLNHPIKGGCPILNFGMEADDTSPVIRDIVNQAIGDIQHFMKALLQKGIDDGEFKPDWDIHTFVVKAFAMLEGGILVSRIAQDNSQMLLLINLMKQEIDAQLL
ncbi:TetR/AcrR family transcriptional regulator [Chitinophaga sp. S165]|uniref:TetR/AcrR family transcriptional regulator n=1 Tax=Chitinophaga sp. S165 TaxID=2135462 RepID=UPI000D98942B|nr:TetR/AcrR family transcriptional regulator [Chitinophaga sp. S165]PWV56314.1 TetR family transcriptional regulator [Chitinophaga sp. S165]